MRIPGPKEAAPCRSCAHWTDQKIEVCADFGGGICNGVCSKAIEPRSFHTYGVDNQLEGQIICGRYIHEGWQW